MIKKGIIEFQISITYSTNINNFDIRLPDFNVKPSFTR